MTIIFMYGVFYDKNNTEEYKEEVFKKTCPKSYFLETAVNIWNILPQWVLVHRNSRKINRQQWDFCPANYF